MEVNIWPSHGGMAGRGQSLSGGVSYESMKQLFGLARQLLRPHCGLMGDEFGKVVLRLIWAWNARVWVNETKYHHHNPLTMRFEVLVMGILKRVK